MFAKTLELIAETPEYADLLVCPETMGKQAQIGTVEEVIELCKMGQNVYPCVDFGHVNSLYGGILKTANDFETIVKKMIDGIGEEKTKNMHVHFQNTVRSKGRNPSSDVCRRRLRPRIRAICRNYRKIRFDTAHFVRIRWNPSRRRRLNARYLAANCTKIIKTRDINTKAYKNGNAVAIFCE